MLILMKLCVDIALIFCKSLYFSKIITFTSLGMKVDVSKRKYVEERRKQRVKTDRRPGPQVSLSLWCTSEWMWWAWAGNLEKEDFVQQYICTELELPELAA